MDWRDKIDLNPSVLAGKPVVRGTRLSVDFILGLMGQGWSEIDVLRNYPGGSSPMRIFPVMPWRRFSQPATT
jgi:uncharacterized protein (DUF433 family)